MNKENRLGTSVPSLKEKTVVLTGATGGLGRAMSFYLMNQGARLIMVNRSREKSRALLAALQEKFPEGKAEYLLCDLENMEEVKALSSRLMTLPVDVLMLNAGTYAIPRALSSAGYDTVFQTNFLSQYYLARKLLPVLKTRHGKIVATGSIAHRFHSVDFSDPDYAHHEGANDIYGNSKRFLIFALMELAKEQSVSFAVGHPGISFTGITSHYPPEILNIVRFSMKILFMPPEKACMGILKALSEDVPYLHWAGPRYFDIWGKPVISPLESCDKTERTQIYAAAEAMYEKL